MKQKIVNAHLDLAGRLNVRIAKNNRPVSPAAALALLKKKYPHILTDAWIVDYPKHGHRTTAVLVNCPHTIFLDSVDLLHHPIRTCSTCGKRLTLPSLEHP